MRLVILVFSISCMMTSATFAVSIVQCKHNDTGELSFHKHCPPGTTELDKKRINTSVGTASNEGSVIMATMYMIADCDACEEVREFLSAKGVQLTEKDVSDDIELQNELKGIAGVLKVPVIVIGETVLTGYTRSKLEDALIAAGYTEDEVSE